jgi:hypothetical protein
VCDAKGGSRIVGGSWAPNNMIYFSSIGLSGLWRVSAKGGTPEPFTKLQGGEISHRSPQVLPGGGAVLFTSRTGPGSDELQVQVQRVSSGERRLLARGESGAYLPTGHLVYVHAATGTLVAVPFDLTSSASWGAMTIFPRTCRFSGSYRMERDHHARDRRSTSQPNARNVCSGLRHY